VPARALLGALVLVLATTTIPLLTRPAAAATGGDSRRRPNILFVLADDLDLAEMRYLPHVRALLASSGTTFDQYLVSNSLCCPSRATTLRGQYAHNTGVWSNGGDNGGFERAHADGVEQDTVATHLHQAGYTTSLAGKYLNGYPNGASPDDVPPGWDQWASAVSGNPYSEYRYVLNQNQTYHIYRHRPRDYGTNVYVGLTDRFVRGAARSKRPFFAYLSVYAPHQPAVPAKQDLTKFPHARAPRTPSFNQADVSRSPSYVRDLPQFSPEETQAIDVLYRRRIRSLQAVDRGVARLVDTLRATKQLDNTYIVFASDNGFHLGQHRLPAGKQTPYETDIHVPLIVRGPGVRAGAHVTQLAGNSDLAPTFEAMAGAHAPSFTDGQSLLPLLRGEQPKRWRTSYLLEHRGETGTTQPARAMPPRGSTLEPPDPDQAGPNGRPRHREIRDSMLLNRGAEIPDYDGVRTSRWVYVEYKNGQHELYDLQHDPDEVQNLAGTRPVVERMLAERVAQLRNCSGAACHRAEAGASSGKAARTSGASTAQRLAPATRGAATMRSLR
jgi:arylsulfatase A-like enzyme